MNYDPHTGEPMSAGQTAAEPMQAARETPTRSVRFRVPKTEINFILDRKWLPVACRQLLILAISLVVCFLLSLISVAANAPSAIFVLVALASICVFVTFIVLMIRNLVMIHQNRKLLETEEYSAEFQADRMIWITWVNGVSLRTETIPFSQITKQRIKRNYRLIWVGWQFYFVPMQLIGNAPAPTAAPAPQMNYNPYTNEPIGDPKEPAAQTPPSGEPTRSVRFRVPPEEIGTILKQMRPKNLVPLTAALLIVCAIMIASGVSMLFSGSRVLAGVLFTVPAFLLLCCLFFWWIFRSSGKKSREILQRQEYVYDFYPDRFEMTVLENGKTLRIDVVENAKITKRQEAGNYTLFWKENQVYFVRNESTPTAPEPTAAPAPEPTAAPAQQAYTAAPAPQMNFDPYTGEPTGAANPVNAAAQTPPQPVKQSKKHMLWLVLAIVSLVLGWVSFPISLAVSSASGMLFPFAFLPLVFLPLPIVAIIMGAKGKKADPHYKGTMIGGIVISVAICGIALFSAMIGALDIDSRRSDLAESKAFLDEYRTVAQIEIPEPDSGYFYDYTEQETDAHDDPDPTVFSADPIHTTRFARLSFEDTEAAEQLLAAATANENWIASPLPNRLWEVTSGISCDWRSKYTEVRVFYLILNLDTGEYNTVPAAPGSYRFVVMELTVTRELTGKNPSVTADLRIEEYVLDYVG